MFTLVRPKTGLYLSKRFGVFEPDIDIAFSVDDLGKAKLHKDKRYVEKLSFIFSLEYYEKFETLSVIVQNKG